MREEQSRAQQRRDERKKRGEERLRKSMRIMEMKSGHKDNFLILLSEEQDNGLVVAERFCIKGTF